MGPANGPRTLSALPAGRGLRYVAEWHGQWLALAGWQTGVFQCAPLDHWIGWVGWIGAVRMRRLHLSGNNTRFPVLPASEGLKILGSYVPGANPRHLGADWERRRGIRCCTIVKPSAYRGNAYLAANWIPVGLTQG